MPADQDFSGCLELTKTQAVQKLRAFYQTPLSPGCYLRIRTRVKLVSAAFPTVSIVGWPEAAGNGHLTGVNEAGPVTSLNTYGEVVELSAIVGSGNCTGVESVDSTFATLNYSKARNVVVQGNTFNAISEPIYNLCILEHTQTWTVDFAPSLPFNGRARTVEAVVPVGAIQSGSANIYELPHSQAEQGGSGSQVKLN